MPAGRKSFLSALDDAFRYGQRLTMTFPLSDHRAQNRNGHSLRGSTRSLLCHKKDPSSSFLVGWARGVGGGGTADAEIKIPSTEIPELLRIERYQRFPHLSLKHLCISPATRSSTVLAVFPGSFNFICSNFLQAENDFYVTNCMSDFTFWFDEMCVVLIWQSRETGC